MDKKFISSRQFMIIVILYSIGTTVLFIPTSMSSYAKQDGWIAPLLSLIIGLIILWLYIKVSLLNPDKTFTESMEVVLGKWLGLFFSMNFVLFCLITGASLVWYVGYFINTQFMGQTPLWFTHIIFTVVIVYATRKGIESIVRTAEILFITVLIILIMFFLSIIPNVKLENIQPLFQVDLQSISTATYFCLSIILLPCIVLLTVFPVNMRNIQKSKYFFLIGYTIAALTVFLIVIVTIMALGSTISSKMMFSSFWLTKKIQFFIGLERIEVIIAIIWLITIFYRVLFYFYGAVIGLSNILKLEDYRFITMPIGIVFVVFSLIAHPNIVLAHDWDVRVWPSMALTFGLLLPLLLVIIGAIKKKKEHTNDINKNN